MTSRAAFLLFGLSIGMLIAGCGGGASSASSTSSSAATTGESPVVRAESSSLDKAEFLERANAVCRKVKAGRAQKIATYERRTAGEKPGTYVDVAHFVFLPAVEEEIVRVNAIGPPVGEREHLRLVLNAELVAIGAVTVNPKVATIAAAEQYLVKSGRLLRAYGLSACANGNRRR